MQAIQCCLCTRSRRTCDCVVKQFRFVATGDHSCTHIVFQDALQEDEMAITLVNFPMLGMGDFCDPPAKPRMCLFQFIVTLQFSEQHIGGPVAQSLFTPDEVINHHLRFSTLTRNIRERRGSRVDMRVPMFRDTNTVESVVIALS